MLDQDLEYVELVYVGKKQFKEDNVANSGTVWFGYGDCKKVAKKLFPLFARHPDVWVLNEHFKTEASPQVVTQINSAVPPVGSTGTDGDEDLLGSDQDNSGEGDTPDPFAPAGDQSGADDSELDSSGGDNSEGSDDESKSDDTNSPDRQALIVNAIMSLEQGNPSHFSAQNGSPLIAAVRTAAGDSEISVKEMNAAWKALNTQAE